MRQSDAKRRRSRFDGRYEEIGNIGDPCVYCGVVSNSFDHIPPLHYAERISDIELDLFRPRKVPTCNECNVTLTGLLIPYLKNRRAYLLEKYRNRYRRYLSIPEWGKDELKELDYSLSSMISRTKHFRDYTRERIRRLSLSNYHIEKDKVSPPNPITKPASKRAKLEKDEITEEGTISWTSEVIIDESNKWIRINMYFATKEEAEKQVTDFSWLPRWARLQIIHTRVIRSNNPVDYCYRNGEIITTTLETTTTINQLPAA